MKGDWINSLMDDLKMLDIPLNEDLFSSLTKAQFKNMVKKNVRSATFKLLKETQQNHIKIKHIEYEQFQMQPYLTSHLFSNDEVSTLFNLRASTINGYKSSTSSMYRKNMGCKLGCLEVDSPAHTLQCGVIRRHIGSKHTVVKFDDIFSNTDKQRIVLSQFILKDVKRSVLLKERETSSAYQGLVLDVSTRPLDDVLGEGQRTTYYYSTSVISSDE